MTEVEKAQIDMRLEVVMLAVSDVDRTKSFYEKLGFRLDIDLSHGDFRGVQMTPYNSAASIIFGKGINSVNASSRQTLILAVDNVDAAREDLVARSRRERGFSLRRRSFQRHRAEPTYLGTRS